MLKKKLNIGSIEETSLRLVETNIISPKVKTEEKVNTKKKLMNDKPTKKSPLQKKKNWIENKNKLKKKSMLSKNKIKEAKLIQIENKIIEAEIQHKSLLLSEELCEKRFKNFSNQT